MAPAHLIVLVDAISELPSEDFAVELESLLAVGDDIAACPRIVAASLRNRGAVADRILALQAELGDRAVVNVIAVGESGRGRPTVRFTVADVLAAGAVIDALVDRGIDHISPEAAVAAAAFVGLNRASKHLISASGSGREAIADGRAEELATLVDRDASTEVSEFLDGAFRPVP